MSVTYKELKRLIRFKEKDNNEIRFSDYDIKEALNECIRYFNNSYALQNSDFLEKTVVFNESEMNAEVAAQNEELDEDEQLSLYDFKRTGVELPDDFVSLQGIAFGNSNELLHPTEGIRIPHYNEYKITGDRLYLGAPYVRMIYKAALSEVKDEADVIEVPFIFKDTLAKITCMILENSASTDTLMEAVNNAAVILVGRRRYANARIRMPFMV
ncbi:MAG: hypothetical protein LUG91_09025 [Ruminococcus sp.]|nr:hypothetical protein [Ruminococcus sp.]